MSRDWQALFASENPIIMGILNMTPDSFYPGSRHDTSDPTSLARRAVEMQKAGAGIIDIGAESTRPGAQYLDEKTEMSRLLPAVRAVRSACDIPISIDTRKASVARAALDMGADIINDISALRDDSVMIDVGAEYGCPIVLMHMIGNPQTMQVNPAYQDVIQEVHHFLAERAQFARAAGVQHIVLDPGIGFGKRIDDNLALLAGIQAFKDLGYPILIGHSRKGFIGSLLGQKDQDGTIVQQAVEDRLAGSLAVAIWCANQGASILRVHDVAATADAIRMTRILEQSQRSLQSLTRGQHV